MSVWAGVVIGVVVWLLVIGWCVCMAVAAARGDRMQADAIRRERQRRWREVRRRDVH